MGWPNFIDAYSSLTAKIVAYDKDHDWFLCELTEPPNALYLRHRDNDEANRRSEFPVERYLISASYFSLCLACDKDDRELLQSDKHPEGIPVQMVELDCEQTTCVECPLWEECEEREDVDDDEEPDPNVELFETEEGDEGILLTGEFPWWKRFDEEGEEND